MLFREGSLQRIQPGEYTDGQRPTVLCLGWKKGMGKRITPLQAERREVNQRER